MISWQLWLHHPERSRFRNAIFQIHLWIGAAASAYVFLMSVSGAIIVHRNQLPNAPTIEWIVKLHDTLLFGSNGRFLNGIGGICLVVLSLTGSVIWWPGAANWRRSLSVNWRSHFARINWDLHSAVGFWGFLFVLVWGMSGVYFAFPMLFNFLFILDPADRRTDQGLFVLSQLHFGRFGLVFQIVWSVVGLAPAILAFTGMFICCRRVVFKKPSNPRVPS